MIPRISLIHWELVPLLKNWSDPGAGQVSVPFVFTNRAHGIIESYIHTSHLVTAAIGFAKLVVAIYPVLATMLAEIGVNCVELGVDVFGGISNDGSKLFVRQQIMTICCPNRFLSSLQKSDEIIQ